VDMKTFKEVMDTEMRERIRKTQAHIDAVLGEMYRDGAPTERAKELGDQMDADYIIFTGGLVYDGKKVPCHKLLGEI
jgi:hypothetical protein